MGKSDNDTGTFAAAATNDQNRLKYAKSPLHKIKEEEDDESDYESETRKFINVKIHELVTCIVTF